MWDRVHAADVAPVERRRLVTPPLALFSAVLNWRRLNRTSHSHSAQAFRFSNPMDRTENNSAFYPPQDSWPEIRLSNVISALSFALDLTEGQPMGHAVNCCLLGTRVAEIIGLPESARNDLDRKS